MWKNRFFKKYSMNQIRACGRVPETSSKFLDTDVPVEEIGRKLLELEFPLHSAIDTMKNPTKVVQWLLDNCCDILKVNLFDETALHVACAIGDVETVQLLLDKEAQLQYLCDFDGNTALHFACLTNNPKIVEILILHGSDSEARNKYGKTPILVACEEGRLETVKLLLNIGAAVFKFTHAGDTALHLAAESGNADLIKLILKAGIGSNVRSPQSSTNETALHIACAIGNYVAVETLLETGAEVNVLTWHKETPFHYLCDFRMMKKFARISDNESGRTCQYHLHQSSDRVKIGNLLFKAGADLRIHDDLGQTVLHKLCRYCICTKVDLLKLVLKKGAAATDLVNMKTTGQLVATKIHGQFHNISKRLFFLCEPGVTCLHLACANSNITIIKLLLSALADPNVKTSLNWTPLHCAAKCTYTRGKLQKIIGHILRALDNNPPEHLSLENSEGKTVLHYLISPSSSRYRIPFEGLLDILECKSDDIGRDLAIRTPDRHGQTALMYMVHCDNIFDLNLVSKIIEAGTDLDFQYTNTTLVEEATYLHKTDVLEIILRYNVPISTYILQNDSLYFETSLKTMRLLIQAGCHEIVAQHFAIVTEQENKDACMLCLKADPLIANRLYDTVVKHSIEDEEYDTNLGAVLQSAARNAPDLFSLCTYSIRKTIADCMIVERYSIIPSIQTLQLPGLIKHELCLPNMHNKN